MIWLWLDDVPMAYVALNGVFDLIASDGRNVSLSRAELRYARGLAY